MMEHETMKSAPFYSWIPKPIGAIILILLFVPPTFSGGAYLSNAGEMVGGMGIWSEDVQLASFFTSIGMCLFPPFMVGFLQARRIKQTYRYCFLALIALNLVCALSTSVPLLLVTCLLTGFVRIMVMLNCTFTIAPYLTGMNTLAMFTMTETPSHEMQANMDHKRAFLMPVLYFVILLIAQSSNYVTAWCAYTFHWRDAYLITVAMLLAALLLVELTMADVPRTKRWIPDRSLLPEMVAMAIALCSMAYALTYGKTLDWLDSYQIRIALAAFLASLGVFLFLASRKKAHHYLPFEIFRYRNSNQSLLLFFLAIVFNSAIALLTTFAKVATPADNLHCASLSLWAVLGCFVGLVLSIVFVVRRAHYRYAFSLAFLLMAVANVLLYFQYNSIGLFSNLILPTVLNYAGLLILYSLVASFGMRYLPSRLLATYVFAMIWMRNAIAPVVGSAVYANWLNLSLNDYLSRVPSQALLRAMQNVTGGTIIMLAIVAALTIAMIYKKSETA